MENLETVEIKVFLPAKDYLLSKSFYTDLGFTLASDGDGVAYFYHGNCSFLLQDFYQEEFANNLMMHLLVEDVDAWHSALQQRQIAQKYQVALSDVVLQPWRMKDFTLHDPSGVLWRIGQNTD